MTWQTIFLQPDRLVKSFAIQLFVLMAASSIPLMACQTDTVSRDFAKVESATFTRGANVAADVMNEGRKAHLGPDWDEGPKHQVEVSAFRIARQQITMKEFAAFKPDYRKHFGFDWNDDDPARYVSWNEAKAYCEWRSKNSGQQFRLPTEAEWELAASQSDKLGLDGIADGTQEWCHDWWSNYSVRKLNNPCGPESGTVRVVRDGGGGSVEEPHKANEPVVDFRITDRSATVPGDKQYDLGFRIVIGEPIEGSDEQQQDELPSEPFVDVNEKRADWTAQMQTAPVFWAGGKFIEAPAEQFNSLPYWNRHHVPSLTFCDNGDLLATSFTAPFDNSDQMAILITRLRYGSKKWDAPGRFFVAPDHNVTSATLFNAGDGTIHHYNGLGNNRCDNFSMIKRISRDNGVTWSEPKIVHRFPPVAASPERPLEPSRLWPHMDLKSYRDKDGQRTLLMSTDVGAGNELGSAIFSSTDEGDSWKELTRQSWQAFNFATKGKQAGWIAGIHAPFELLADGSFYAVGRSNNIDGFAPLSRSSNFGKTWTYSASPFPPILSGQRSVLMRLEEGPLLFISFTDSSIDVRAGKIKGMNFEDSNGNMKNGSGIFSALSFDEGATWPKKKLIPNWDKRPWKSRYSGYLSCVQSPDRMLHLVNSKFYYRFNLEWLRESMPAKIEQ